MKDTKIKERMECRICFMIKYIIKNKLIYQIIYERNDNKKNRNTSSENDPPIFLFDQFSTQVFFFLTLSQNTS
jgi:hypothetical protein